MGVWPRPETAAARGAVSVGLVLLVLGPGCVSACSSSGDPAPTGSSGGPASLSPASPSSDVTAAASRDAMVAYRGFWAAQVTAQADPSAPIPPELRTYAIDTALTDEQSALVLYRQQGIRFQGAPVLSPEVVSVTVAEPPRVVITDCVDASNWIPVYAATGKPASAPGQPTRVPVEAVATTYSGRWVIRSSTVFRGRTC